MRDPPSSDTWYLRTQRLHSWFESFHRYTGWSAVVTLWLFIFISALYESNDAVRGGDNWVDDTTVRSVSCT